jgi:hypothetical protein
MNGVKFLRVVAQIILIEFLKNICREDIDLRILVLPGIRGETGLLTGVLQESLAVPSIFGGDLREEKA